MLLTPRAVAVIDPSGPTVLKVAVTDWPETVYFTELVAALTRSEEHTS